MTVSISSIPSYGDLGEADSVTKNTWEAQLSRYSTYDYYYTGAVFDEVVDDAEVANPPSLYPVGINVVKMLVQSLADATFGEWDSLPVEFHTRKGVDEKPHTVEAATLLNTFLYRSGAESTFLEMEIHRMLYGASVLRIRPENSSKIVTWLSIKPPTFFPVFDPHNKNKLLQATILTSITRAQAELRYSYTTKKDEVTFEEYWDLHKHWVKLDGKQKIEKYSGRNPYGLIPFVYTPRMRSTSVWGDSIADDIIPVQNELNMRVADIGEAINVNSHPIRWGYNLPRGFSAKNFSIGSDAMWDLGRAFGDHEPKVGALEIKNPVPNGALEYNDWLYDWVRTSAFAPPIAFGEDEGGGQRSGTTLEIRMWPLVKAVRRHRAYARTGLRQACEITGRILKQKNYKTASVDALDAMTDGSVEPNFAEILPRDRASIVDEVVKRLSTNPPTISLESALRRLGSDSIEDERIVEMVEKYGLNQKKEADPSQMPEEADD